MNGGAVATKPELFESQARRATALENALGPLTDLLADQRRLRRLGGEGSAARERLFAQRLLERVGEGVVRTRITLSAADAEQMLRLGVLGPRASRVLQRPARMNERPYG